MTHAKSLGVCLEMGSELGGQVDPSPAVFVIQGGGSEYRCEQRVCV